MTKIKTCVFCGADKKHFKIRRKTKTYEVELPNGDSTITEVHLDIVECLKCKGRRRWCSYDAIERAINKVRYKT